MPWTETGELKCLNLTQPWLCQPPSPSTSLNMCFSISIMDLQGGERGEGRKDKGRRDKGRGEGRREKGERQNHINMMLMLQ